MRNVKLIIEYDGANYSGWQAQQAKSKEQRAQKQKETIQETLEKTLSQLLQEKIKVIGSGRTDAGVHAQGQVANFKTKSKLSCQNIKDALNGLLPKDIRIKQAREVGPNFHARFSAQSKIYRYSLVNGSFVSPFLCHYAYLVKPVLDVKKMRQACRYLCGQHNFRSFQAVDKKERHPVRTIKRLHMHKDKSLIYLEVEADGFLYRMVRNIIGTLIEVGRGRIKPANIKAILQARNRVAAGPCAPAKGLCLLEVKY